MKDTLKKVLKKVSYYNMDEMQSYILLKSQRNSFFFLITALFLSLIHI